MAGTVFGVFCLVSVLSAIITGNPEAVGNALFSGAADAVTLTLSLGGAMCLWGGLMEVLREVGVLSCLERLLSPLFYHLFSDLRRNETRQTAKSDADSSGMAEVTASFSANLLGIGNAATPIGLRAMEKLRQYREEPDQMSNAEILFVVMNTAPPTILPTTLLTLRHASGSFSPASVLCAVWIVSFLGCIFSLIVTRALEGCGKREKTR